MQLESEDQLRPGTIGQPWWTAIL